MSTIKELKDRRDALWAKLDAIKASEEPVREEIKRIQSELFVMEMTPVMLKLEVDISAGLFEGDMLKEKQQKLENLKKIILGQ